MASILNALQASGAALTSFAGEAASDETLRAQKGALEQVMGSSRSLLNGGAAPTPPPQGDIPTDVKGVLARAGVSSIANAPSATLSSIRPDLTQITAPGGAKLTVAKQAADSFQGLINDLEKAGYTLDPATSGGYNPRMIAGTNTPSMHAYGLAVDVNSARNPQGKQGDIPPELARALAAKYGLTWGGDWQGATRDPMHFEATSMRPGGSS